ncbi:MarR family winged helix-turn-helix transcriptional regulator [Glaciimonas sp. PCH181]|uniref:MarR family winged helix-turn-helix transcriptional regulator n=1 Tax=Glaciimonas sp. PCH181 TaxID=2133943 RepID=UPI001374ACE8|nr:MarR family transcriptional regulator [Glaciimonas sp. PCH181]
MATKIFDRKELDPCNALDYLVGKVRAAILAALDQEIQPLDITAAQYAVIVNLGNAQPGSIATLCKTLSYDPGAMTRMIDRLERKYLVKRLQSLDDRREKTLELTEAGFAIYLKISECNANVLRRLLEGFTQEEIKKLKSLMHKLLANT